MPRKINRIVKVEQGVLEGIPCGNPAYTVFKGVPYAKPPVGDLRFTHPQPAESFEGVRKCDTFPPIAVQSVGRTAGQLYDKEFFPAEMPMSEDCLYLNVWTPDTEAKNLPVMFWIHGGGFTGGYGHEMEFDGEAFCRRDVILVTITYRLGALGFFAHPELRGSGNMGAGDCIAALKWVHQNIASFGGNPNNITVFGQSAGGALTQVLLASPLTKGLMNRAIVQSAGGINTLGGDHSLKDAEALGVKICETLGKTVDELKEMDAIEMNEAINGALAQMGMFLAFLPCVDGYVLNKAAGRAIAEGEHHDIEYMTGSVSGDSMFGGFPAQNREQFEAMIRAASGDKTDRVLALYDLNDIPAANAAKGRASSLLAPRGWAKAENKNGRKPAYIYYFDRKMPGDDNGAFHSSELWYIFGTLDRCWRSLEKGFTPFDYVLSRTMTNYWTNFAKTGDPNGGNVPEWKPFTPETPFTMYMDEKTIEQRDMSGDKVLDGMVDLLVEDLVK